jgi:hypothetical protein
MMAGKVEAVEMKKGFWLVVLTCAIVGWIGEAVLSREVVYALIDRRIEKYETVGTPLGGFATMAVLPGSFAVGNGGDVYVTESSFPSKILQFNRNGALIKSFGPPTPVEGEPDAHFLSLAFGPDGNLYAGANSGTDRVERFSADGTSLGIFATTQTGVGAPNSLAFDRTGNLFVDQSYSIKQFDEIGTALGDFVTSQEISTGIAFDSTGNLYRVTAADRVDVFSPAGQIIRTITPDFRDVFAIALDRNDVLYLGGSITVSRSTHAIIQKFLPDGTPLETIVQVPPQPGFGSSVTEIVIVDEIPEPITITMLFAGIFVLILRRQERCPAAQSLTRR